MSVYRHNYKAFGTEVLNADFMVALMLEHAGRIQVAFVATAPDATPYGVGFKYSTEVSAGKHGGLHKDRAYGAVTSTDPDAVYIEFGTAHSPAHRTLTRAMEAGR